MKNLRKVESITDWVLDNWINVLIAVIVAGFVLSCAKSVIMDLLGTSNNHNSIRSE